MNRKISLLTLAALLASTAASISVATEVDLSACEFAEQPVIVDGTKASKEEMTESASQVRNYIGAMQDSLACLEQVEKDLGEKITAEQKVEVTDAYNTGVDKLNAVANNYNEQVRAFKNR